MKYLIASLLLIFVGCSTDPIHTGPAIIVNKYYQSYEIDTKFPCKFYYIGLGMEGDQMFTDSCDKYSVGDTIKRKP